MLRNQYNEGELEDGEIVSPEPLCSQDYNIPVNREYLNEIEKLFTESTSSTEILKQLDHIIDDCIANKIQLFTYNGEYIHKNEGQEFVTRGKNIFHYLSSITIKTKYDKQKITDLLTKITNASDQTHIINALQLQYLQVKDKTNIGYTPIQYAIWKSNFYITYALFCLMLKNGIINNRTINGLINIFTEESKQESTQSVLKFKYKIINLMLSDILNEMHAKKIKHMQAKEFINYAHLLINSGVVISGNPNNLLFWNLVKISRYYNDSDTLTGINPVILLNLSLEKDNKGYSCIFKIAKETDSRNLNIFESFIKRCFENRKFKLEIIFENEIKGKTENILHAIFRNDKVADHLTNFLIEQQYINEDNLYMFFTGKKNLNDSINQSYCVPPLITILTSTNKMNKNASYYEYYNTLIRAIVIIVKKVPHICKMPLDENNKTLLMLAIEHKQLNPLIKDILQYSDKNQKDKENQNAWNYAELYLGDISSLEVDPGEQLSGGVLEVSMDSKLRDENRRLKSEIEVLKQNLKNEKKINSELKNEVTEKSNSIASLKDEKNKKIQELQDELIRLKEAKKESSLETPPSEVVTSNNPIQVEESSTFPSEINQVNNDCKRKRDSTIETQNEQEPCTKMARTDISAEPLYDEGMTEKNSKDLSLKNHDKEINNDEELSKGKAEMEEEPKKAYIKKTTAEKYKQQSMEYEFEPEERDPKSIPFNFKGKRKGHDYYFFRPFFKDNPIVQHSRPGPSQQRKPQYVIDKIKEKQEEIGSEVNPSPSKRLQKRYGIWSEALIYHQLKAHYTSKYDISYDSDESNEKIVDRCILKGKTKNDTPVDVKIEIVWHNKNHWKDIQEKPLGTKSDIPESKEHTDIEVVKTKISDGNDTHKHYYIEVKSTLESRQNFATFSKDEWKQLVSKQQDYVVYRVFNAYTKEAYAEKVKPWEKLQENGFENDFVTEIKFTM